MQNIGRLSIGDTVNARRESGMATGQIIGFRRSSHPAAAAWMGVEVMDDRGYVTFHYVDSLLRDNPAKES